MATARKQVLYSSPRLALLTKKKAREGGRPSITLTVPFTFSNRLARCDRRVQSTPNIRCCSSSSLPRIPRPPVKPSINTSNTDNSGSLGKKPGSQHGTSCGSVADPRSTVETGNSDPDVVEQEVLSPEEENERRLTNEKCLQWLEGLPSKFTGIHSVRQIFHNVNR